LTHFPFRSKPVDAVASASVAAAQHNQFTTTVADEQFSKYLAE